MTTPIEKLAQAKQTEADIKAKFIAAQERMDAIVRERIVVALPAQSGDAAAKKKLDALNSERVKLTVEAEPFDTCQREDRQPVT